MAKSKPMYKKKYFFFIKEALLNIPGHMLLHHKRNCVKQTWQQFQKAPNLLLPSTNAIFAVVLHSKAFGRGSNVFKVWLHLVKAKQQHELLMSLAQAFLHLYIRLPVLDGFHFNSEHAEPNLTFRYG